MILRDVALAGGLVLLFSLLGGQAELSLAVAAGVTMAVGSVWAMVWVVEGVFSGTMLGRLGMHTLSLLLLCYLLFSVFPVLPVMVGYGSLILGVGARALLLGWDWRPPPVAEEIR